MTTPGYGDNPTDPGTGYPPPYGHPGQPPAPSQPGYPPVSGGPGYPSIPGQQAYPPPGYPPTQGLPVSGGPGYPPVSGVPGYPPVSGVPGYPPVSGVPGYPPVSGVPGYGPAGPYDQTAGYDQLGPYLGPPMAPIGARKSRKVPIIIAAVVALLLVVGAGAWAAVKFWYGSGPEPEQALPASVLGFARIDLDPSLDQGAKMLKLLHKFPKTEAETGKDLADLERKMFASFEPDVLNYETDVKPWFNHKIGSGAWTDSNKDTYELIVLASSDDAKARTALDKVKANHDGEFGFVVNNGWALIAQGSERGQEAADAAAAEAKRSPLSDNKRYSAALDKLPSGQLLVGWLDVEALRAQGLTRQLYSGALSTITRPSSGGASQDPFGDRLGWAIVGVQATDQGFEMRVRAGGGAKPFQAGADVRPTLDAMPGNSIIAVALGPDPDTSRALVDAADSLGSSVDDRYDNRGTTASESKVQDALRALLGSKVFSLAVTSVAGGVPGLRFSADTGSDAAANKVLDAKGALTTSDFTVAKNGSRIDVTTRGYAPSGALSDVPLYKQTLAGGPDKPDAAFYVDIQSLIRGLNAPGDALAEFAPLKSFGGSSGVEGNDYVGLYRLVIT